jgi:hypothetical protein
MRDLLILGGIGILSASAWVLTADAGTPGHGLMHGPPGHGGLGGHMRHHGGHAGHMGTFFPETLWQLFPGEPELGLAAPGIPTVGLVEGGPGHMIPEHPAHPATHPLAHVAVRGEVVIPQPKAPGGPAAPAGSESDEAGAATVQPNPTTSPSSPRPPGAAGPGRPVSGWSGPGRPGPGRPANPRW